MEYERTPKSASYQSRSRDPSISKGQTRKKHLKKNFHQNRNKKKKITTTKEQRFNEQKLNSNDTFNHFSGFDDVKILKSEYPEKKSSRFGVEKSIQLLSPLNSSRRNVTRSNS